MKEITLQHTIIQKLRGKP